MFHSSRRVLIGLLVALLLAGNSYARTVYKWVDQEGATHYSESPPVSVSATELNLSTAEEETTLATAKDDYYSIQNQLERVQQQRRDYLERQLLKKQIRQQAQSVEPKVVEPVVVEQPVIVGGYHRRHFGFGLGYYQNPCRNGVHCGRHSAHHSVQHRHSLPVKQSKAFKLYSNR